MQCRTLASMISLVLVAAGASAQTLTLTPAHVPSTSGARAIATADFDNNGWSDVAHGNFGGNTVTVLLNNRGTLTKRGDVAVGAGPFDMAAADFNLDGKADLAVANADANTISVLLGRGDGTFVRADIAATGNPRGLTTADMDNDGKPDIVYTGFGNNRVQILNGDGAGRFTTGWSITGVAQRPQGVAAADFNRDGRLDLAVAYASTGGGVAIITTGPSGTAARLGGDDNMNVVAVGDFDKNGWLDVAAASTGNSDLAVYLGDDEGLTWAATYPTGASPRGIIAADIGHDGALDVITANRASNTITVLPMGPSGFLPPVDFAAGRGSRTLVSADFDRDGRRDLATGNQDAASVTLLMNDTSLERAGFGFTRGTLPCQQWNCGSQIVADLNHNHIPDLVMYESSEAIAIVDGTFRSPIAANYEVKAVADFNGDGHQDTVGRAWNGSAYVLRIMHGDGTGRFSMGQDIGVDPVLWYGPADMNRDGRPDLVFAKWDPAAQQSAIDVYLHRADGSWSAPIRTALSNRWAISLALADLNRDGLTDVVTTQFAPNQTNVMLGTGGGNLAAPRVYGSEDYGYAHVADVNEDGWPDVIVGGWERTMTWLGSRTGDLTAGAQYPYGGIWMAFADMNQDGHVDLVSTYAGLIAHGRGDGTFAEPEFFRFDTSHVAIADLNVDGLPDVVGSGVVAFNRRGTQNRPPVIQPIRDVDLEYVQQFGESDDLAVWADAADPDMHALTFEWRDGSGTLLQSGPRDSYVLALEPGEYDITVTARDGRGGTGSDTFHVIIRPNPELVLSRSSWLGYMYSNGTWTEVQDATAAGGTRFHDPNRGAAKVATPLQHPVNHVFAEFAADPTQTYKLWVRLKAENNYWGNDSIFMQFSGATDVNGTPIYRMGTTSGLALNLEQCSGCGISGWGWRDERWGPTLNTAPLLLRFPRGGWQQILIQTREDGVSIDQIVLSAETYRTSAPGPAKNDNTIVVIK